MKKFLNIIIVITMFTLVFIGQAADLRINISVRVVCDDEIITDLINSYTKRELRNFPDVDITKDKPLYTLLIHVIELESKATGQKTGEIIYYAAYVENIYIYDLLDPYFKEKQRNKNALVNLELMEILDSFTTDPSYWLYSNCRDYIFGNDKIEDLQDLCKTIVASFDTNILEVAREKK